MQMEPKQTQPGQMQSQPSTFLWERKANQGQGFVPIPGPQQFDPSQVFTQLANFSQCVYVQLANAIDQDWDYSIYAYTFVPNVDGYRICAVAHLHITGNYTRDNNWRPGHCFIPGLQMWDMQTPQSIVGTLRTQYKTQVIQAISGNKVGNRGHTLAGNFPNDRYPT